MDVINFFLFFFFQDLICKQFVFMLLHCQLQIGTQAATEMSFISVVRLRFLFICTEILYFDRLPRNAREMAARDIFAVVNRVLQQLIMSCNPPLRVPSFIHRVLGRDDSRRTNVLSRRHSTNRAV